MKIFVLKPIDENARPWRGLYDRAYGFVVLAEDVDQARQLASDQAGDEGAAAWLDRFLARCVELDATAPPGVILRDFNAG